jgi:ABC-type polysaccharide/polyol phosphate export permease
LNVDGEPSGVSRRVRDVTRRLTPLGSPIDQFPPTCYILVSPHLTGRFSEPPLNEWTPLPAQGCDDVATYLQSIWHCRYFWLSLVRMDLRHRYRGSVLGIGWSLLHPIAMTAILCAVFQHLFHADIRYYAPFLLAGLACWNYITFVTIQGSLCFLHGEAYIRQFPAPMAIYPLRTALSGGIHFVLALAVGLAASWMLRGPGDWLSLLSLVPSVALLLMLGWALAVLAGLANVYFQDTRHLCEVGFQFLFYATPIIYEPRLLTDRQLGWVLQCNPLVPLLQLVRDPVLEGRVPALSTYAAAAVIVGTVAGLAGVVLARLQRRLIFHL